MESLLIKFWDSCQRELSKQYLARCQEMIVQGTFQNTQGVFYITLLND